jgi:hypothetical protein
VDHDGRIVFTRWDYYDKASHWTGNLWTTMPDGRDPRAPFGNYFYPHQTYDRTQPNGQGTGLGNPQMSQGIRAVPGAPGLYTATVSAVHGGELGSLILIDTNQPDDYGIGQVKRLTPELPFPESEFGNMNFSLGKEIYGYCWPLSPDSLGLADRGDRELPASRQPGQLLGPDTRLPQLGGRHRSAGVDHQGRKCNGTIHFGATGGTCVAA